MKLLKSIVCCLAVSLAFSSCNDWLDINEDPNTPSSEYAQIQQLLPWCQHYVNYAYGVWGYRSTFACQALTATSRVTRDGCSAQWEPTTSLNTTPYQVFFVGAGPNLNDMYDKAMAQGAYHYAGAARLLRAYGFALMADVYGEMPYTEAMGASLTPRYDDGKTIYLGIISEIEEAIELFGQTQAANTPALSEGDSWNGGDVAKWTKMAYLLKARLLNHMSKKAQGDYKQGLYDPDEILACLDKAMQSIDDNTTITHYDISDGTNDVLIADPVQTAPMFDSAGMGGGATTRPTQWLVEILTNFNGVGVEDPRADKILPWLETNHTPGTALAADPNAPGKTLKYSADGVWMRSAGVEMRQGLVDGSTSIRLNGAGPFAVVRNSDDKALDSGEGGMIAPHSWYCDTEDAARRGDTIYVGFRSGATGYYSTTGILYTRDYEDGYAESSSNVFCRPNSNTYWATYAEACFIRAEVLSRKNDAGGAKAAYLNGVRAALQQIQKSLNTWSGETYSRGSLAATPSFSPITDQQINDYVNALDAKGTPTLGEIMTQKFLAMLYTAENWNDMRRMDYTGYVGNGTNNWAKPYEFSVNGTAQGRLPEGVWRRVMHCSHEINYNSNNLLECQQLYPAGYNGVSPTDAEGGVWGVPVWWDTAD